MGAFNGGGGWERFYLSGDIPSPVSMLSNISDVCHHIQTSTMASLSAPTRAVNLLLLCVWDGKKHHLPLLCASANTTQSWMGSWVSYCHPDKGQIVHLVSGESSAFLSFYGPFRGWLSFSKSHFVYVSPLCESLRTQWPCDMQIHCAVVPILFLCQHAFCWALSRVYQQASQTEQHLSGGKWG